MDYLENIDALLKETHDVERVSGLLKCREPEFQRKVAHNKYWFEICF